MSYGIPVIPVNLGSGDYGPAKVEADVLQRLSDHRDQVGIDIKSLLMSGVTLGFHFFERRADPVFQLIEQSRAESITEKVVVEVFYMTPETIITVAAFGKGAVDVRIPFEVAAKSMKDHDIAGSKIFGMVEVEKHP